MSRLTELKKQYPELNISLFDLLQRLDNTKSYKYLSLLCKLFGERFEVRKRSSTDLDFAKWLLDIESNLISKGISIDGLTPNQKYFLHHLTDFYSHDSFEIFSQFKYYIESDKIKNNDVTSYASVEELRSAVSLATLNELTKELENQVIKEFEDEKWVILRPLTFSSSAKYGAGTRWCTTYKQEKQYFEKYWRQGVLVYFINKKTGYKFAGYKDITQSNGELSFWNAEDSRVDFLNVDADEYIYPIAKKIFKSEFTNKNLTSPDVQEQVHNECLSHFERLELHAIEPIEQIVDQIPEMDQPVNQLLREMAQLPVVDMSTRLGRA